MQYLPLFLVSFLGGDIRERVIRWRYKDKNLKEGNFYKIWNKYGIIGLGLLSSLLFGAPLGAALGIALGAEKKVLFIWISIGTIIWSVILTYAGYIGLMTFQLSFNLII